jgi:glucuronoarabinoxylan endo-1,4-beta-xylanase
VAGSRARFLAASLVAGIVSACGDDTAGLRPGGGDRGPAATPDVTVSIDTTARAQTMVGFGASLAFYVNWLTDHPSKDAIYDLIFRDLGLDVLRVGNWLQSSATDAPTAEVVARAAASLGAPPKLLMSSWSPPAAMKSNNDTSNGGTLIQQNGAYAYDQLGAWWASSLAVYAAAGVHPDFISMQNEPDFTASWQSCRFAATETATRAGYGPALAATAAALAAQGTAPAPQLLGPELSGLGGNRLATYLAGLDASMLGGIAHHLYTGGDMTASPDSYADAMTAAAAAANGKPLFMTEYSPTSPDFFNTALMIHDAVTVEGVSAYLYWGLIWAPPAAGASPTGLVTTESPFSPDTWTTPQGYIVNPAYYAIKHYARWIDAGWQRVGVASSASGIRASAFASPDGATVTVVLLNADGAAHAVGVTSGAFTFTTSAIYRTDGVAEQTAPVGALGAGGVVTVPSMGAATVVLGP